MLPDERTTQSNDLPLPSDVEGLIVAPARAAARPLVGFLQDQGINVRISCETNAAFEEALLHPPDVVLVDDRLPPTGGVDLCQRLKGNVRTHFVPIIIFAANEAGAFRVKALSAGADAVFSPATDAQEQRARLWSLLRTRALHRRIERKQLTQKNEIIERRNWLSHFLHDLKGNVAALSANVAFLAKFRPPPGDARRRDFDESVDDVRGVFEQLNANVRTVLDYDRLETGQLVPRETRFLLGDAAAEVVDELRRHAAMAEKTLTFSRSVGERAVSADRELIVAAMLYIGMGAIRRAPPRAAIAFDVAETDTGARFRAFAPGSPLQPSERMHLFEPYGRRGTGSATYGLGLALAQALIGLHDGRIWAEDADGQGCTFVFELGWQRGSGARSRRAPRRRVRDTDRDPADPT